MQASRRDLVGYDASFNEYGLRKHLDTLMLKWSVSLDRPA
jgi:hypothetical protein